MISCSWVESWMATPFAVTITSLTLKPACAAGRGGHHIADLYLRIIGHAHLEEQKAENHDAQQEVHGWPGQQDRQARPGAGSRQTARYSGIILTLRVAQSRRSAAS